MKSILLTAIALLSLVVLKAQTTEQDYNYITKGYKDDKTNGRPIATGYSIELVSPGEELSWTVGDKNEWRKATLYYLKRNSKKVAFMVECTDHSGALRYMCIPSNDASSDLWSRMQKDFDGVDGKWKSVFIMALSKVTSKRLL